VSSVTGDHEQFGGIRSEVATRPVLPATARRAAADRAGGDLVDDLFRAHAVTLVRVAMLLLGDQPSAEDVVQEAFFGLYRSLPKLRDRSKALPYLRASVINGSRSVLRARQRAVLRGVHHEPAVWSAESAAMAGEDRKALLAAVATGRTRLVASFPGTEGGPAAVTFDPTGRYMIVESVVRTGPTTKLGLVDIATGQLTWLNASWAVDPAIAW
jgi:hypothetical protein